MTAKYTVLCGYQHNDAVPFDDFTSALALYMRMVEDREDNERGAEYDPMLIGEGYDYCTDTGVSTGLTSEEEDAVEEAEAMFDRMRRTDAEDHDPAHDPGCNGRW